MHAWIATLLLAGVGAGVVAAQSHARIATLEPTSRFEFSMHTRWGQELVGRFHDTAGEVVALADGKRQVVLSLATSTVEIIDHSRYTRFARGPRFFDAERFPQVVFVSEPYSAELLTTGGEMYGKLRMHGIERRERFVVAPAQCARPGRDCAIFAKGVVMRANYDLDTWRMAMRDDVRFSLEVRLRDVAPEAR